MFLEDGMLYEVHSNLLIQIHTDSICKPSRSTQSGLHYPPPHDLIYVNFHACTGEGICEEWLLVCLCGVE